MSYQRGNVVELTGVFVDDDGEPGDPTTVTLTVKYSNGSVESYTPTSGTPGTWTYDLYLDDSIATGRVYYRFKGNGAAGTIRAAMEGNFQIEGSDVID